MNNFGYWLILFERITFATQDRTCNVYNTTEGNLYANCFNQNINVIPINLGNGLKILNISSNPLIRLLMEDIEPYPDLIELNLQSIKTVQNYKFDSDLLLPLTKLEILHISDTNVQLPPLNLPSSIKKLYANRLPRTMAFIDFSVLTQLTHLELDDCNLHTLPTLHKEAPLVHLHIQFNFMDKLSYLDLAPYCLLRELLLNVSNLSKNDLFGRCCDLLIWLEEHKVINTIECQINSFPEPCDIGNYSPVPQAAAEYDQCLIRNGLLRKSSVWLYFTIFIVLILILFAGYGGYKFYHFYKARQAARKLEDEDEDEKSR